MFRNVLAACALLVSIVGAVPVVMQDRSFDYKSAALSYVGKQWGVTPSNSLQFDSSVGGSSKTYAFLRQQQNGVPIDNTYATVVFDQSNTVASFDGKKVDFNYVAANLPNISPKVAFAAGEAALEGTEYDGTWNGEFSYIGVPGSSLSPARNGTALVFSYYAKFKDTTSGVTYGAYIDASNSQVRLVKNLQTGVYVVSP
ncbi:hypothetical protein QCA50_006764 [Cerrena zonata]|uniref:Uncharacterized protein n=1 Tax=Cerrena zonata TaxID=2478898 RepID=A0AAW0GB75_9APHY